MNNKKQNYTNLLNIPQYYWEIAYINTKLLFDSLKIVFIEFLEVFVLYRVSWKVLYKDLEIAEHTESNISCR